MFLAGVFLRGSVDWQVNQVFLKSDIFRPGESKHLAKEAARAGGARSWADIGGVIDIHSYATARTYKDVWHQFGHFAKDVLGVRDLEELRAEHVCSFLESCVAGGVRYSTFQKYAAALGKFERAFNLFAVNTGSGKVYDFRSKFDSVRKEAARMLVRGDKTRAYKSPDFLISALGNESHGLIASIQLEGGARIYEASLIHGDQLEGLTVDEFTGKDVGLIRLDPGDTKGGKGRTISVGSDTYLKLRGYIEKHQEFRVNPNHYRKDLKNTAKITRQKYTGSHGLRWNFAQERLLELQKSGFTYEQCLQQVSWDMGHERADITLHFFYMKHHILTGQTPPATCFQMPFFDNILYYLE